MLLSKPRKLLSDEPYFSKCSSKGKKDQQGAKRMIKSSNLKCLPFGRDLTDPMLTPSIEPNGVKEINKQNDHFQLPIMHGYDKSNVRLTGIIRE